MPNAFNFQASPFDCLDAEEQQIVRAGVDIAYFREGDAILDAGMAPTHLFVVIKGFARQYEHGGTEPVAGFGPNDTFDGRSLLTGQVAGRFVAAEEMLAYQLSRELVNGLIARNATFGARLFSDLSNKLAAIAGQRGRHELQSLEMARVDAIAIRAPHFVDADCDVLSVVRLFQSERATNVLVRDGRSDPPRLGIFTVTTLQRAVLHGTPLDRLPVGEIASFGLITVRAGDPVGDALTVMVRHKVHRVVVMADEAEERVIGVLEAMDLFSFLANHSYLINREIAEARDLAALAQACEHITRLIGLLQRGGTRVGQIATLVQALNAKLFERTWQLVAPADLVANSCLFVMGSEGRGEQLLKTDQDNGLLLRDGYAPPEDLEAICARMTQALVDFGYPPCPGGVMLSNPRWRGGEREFADRAQGWLLQPDGDNLMSLAIFLDAHAVCGDASLLAGVRERLFQIATDNEPMLARFASVVDAFATDSGWWQRILDFGGGSDDAARSLDIKKQGLFPLVHGVRSLALAARLADTSTAARLAALVSRGQIERALADDVLQSLHFFMGLRLSAGLAELEARKPVSGSVDPAKLNSLDRDLLKDTLQVVKRLRRMLRLRFHLDAV